MTAIFDSFGATHKPDSFSNYIPENKDYFPEYLKNSCCCSFSNSEHILKLRTRNGELSFLQINSSEPRLLSVGDAAVVSVSTDTGRDLLYVWDCGDAGALDGSTDNPPDVINTYVSNKTMVLSLNWSLRG